MLISARTLYCFRGSSWRGWSWLAADCGPWARFGSMGPLLVTDSLVIVYLLSVMAILLWIPNGGAKFSFLCHICVCYNIGGWLSGRRTTVNGNRMSRKLLRRIQGRWHHSPSCSKFDYKTETIYSDRWETRTVQLSQLMESIFPELLGFAVDRPSDYQFSSSKMEIPCYFHRDRKSRWGLLHDRRSLSSIRDNLYHRGRTRCNPAPQNYRSVEDTYLYHTTASPERSREIFMDYLERANQLNLPLNSTMP